MRIKVSNREAAAYIFLRRLGHRIPQIAQAFGRSNSVVYRRIAANIRHAWERRLDMRTLPHKFRLFNSRKQWLILMKFIPLWEQWICSEEGKPP